MGLAVIGSMQLPCCLDPSPPRVKYLPFIMELRILTIMIRAVQRMTREAIKRMIPICVSVREVS